MSRFLQQFRAVRNTVTVMLLWSAALLITSSLSPAGIEAQAAASARYYPGAGDQWQRRRPAEVGFDSTRLAAAIEFAKAAESNTTRDLEEAHYMTFGREPFGVAVGPFQPRGDQTGVIIRNGYIVASWGEPERIDMTFSVTKSFVSTVVGLAVDRGIIRSIDDLVHPYMAPVLHAAPPAINTEAPRGRFNSRQPIQLFATEHNKRITWKHLLQQSSDWEGTLWDKPEWADRPSNQTATWWTRARVEPGTVHEYNDTRVNVLALAALNVLRRPLPEILRESVMDPIGASPTWRWYGYDNSWVVLDGQLMQSVSGGGHWGGGMFISAWDMARFGLLATRNGKWGDRQIISENWIRLSTTPSTPNAQYGFMNYYVNADKRQLPSGSERAFVHLGNGTNAIICDPENDLVIVLRWVNSGAVDGVLQRVLAAKLN